MGLAAAVVLLILFIAVAWIVGDEREAVGQPTPATTTPSSAPSSASPSAFADDLEGFSDLFPGASASASAIAGTDEPEGIPDLGVMDVVGNLKNYPTRSGFACVGPVPGDGDDAALWSCSAEAEGGGGGSYDVVLVGDDPLAVLSVQATAHGASDEEAARFFGYVAALCLRNSDPLNPEAWVSQNVPAGGQTFADGAEISIYGTDEERTLQVVATDL